MLKDFAWNYFEKTGSIEAFLTYRCLSEVAPTKAVNGENECKSTKKSEDKPTGTDN